MVYIYDKLGKKINYYNFKGDYIRQFLLTRTPYFMTGNGDHLLLIGPEYIIHINTKSKQMDVKNIAYKEFSPSNMWLGTTYKDTAVFFEGTKMVLLKFNLENADFLGTYPIKGKKEWSAKVVERKRGNGAISLLPVSSFANILKYKNYYIIQRRDLKENDKNALLLIDDKSFKIEKIIKFPRSSWLISYYPQEDEFFIIDENRKLAKITPSKLGIK